MADCTEEPTRSEPAIVFRLEDSYNNFRYRVRKKPSDSRRFPTAMDRLAMEKTLLGLKGLPEGVREYGLPDPSAIAKQVPDLSVEYYDEAEVLPDRFSYQSVTVISGRARRVFENVDPEGGHAFVPATVVNKNDCPVCGEWYYMLCGRSFFASEVPIDGDFRSDSTTQTWVEKTYFSTKERRLFFSQQPVWTTAGTVRPNFLSKPVFDEIKAEGLTGFREFTKDFGLAGADDPHIGQLPTSENVSHYWF